MKSKFVVRAMKAVVVLIAVPASAFASMKHNPPKNRVSIEAARLAAQAKFPGAVKSEELEFEGGKWIYSFDLQTGAEKPIQEVHVDALNGRLLDSHTETAADEKKEAAEEN